MLTASSKVFAITVYVALALSPLVVWLGLYAVARLSSWNLRPAFIWIRGLRWVGWGTGVFLFLIYFANNRRILWSFAMGAFCFGLGLSMPERWLKTRFAPDLIEPNPPEEWWPSKRD